MFCWIKHNNGYFCLLTFNKYLPFGALWTAIKHILVLRVIIKHMYNLFKRVFFCFALPLCQSDYFYILSVTLFTIILYFKYSHSNGWNLLPLLNLSILFRPFWFCVLTYFLGYFGFPIFWLWVFPRNPLLNLSLN